MTDSGLKGMREIAVFSLRFTGPVDFSNNVHALLSQK